MASLKEISELVWRQIGTANDEARITLEEVDAAAILEYAWQMLQMAWKNKRDEGEYIVPSYLLREGELIVKDNKADISKLGILKGLPSEMWLQNIGGIGCGCNYVKTTLNMAQLMCEDDSLDDDTKTYYVIGEEINFPKGTHKDTLPIIYANDGSDLNSEDISIDESVGNLVRQALLASYLGKTTPKDVTNNSNPNE